MDKSYKIYLDVCCLNRPLDDSLQERIRLEAEAILLIYRKCRLGEWELIDSEAIQLEISQIKDVDRLFQIRAALKICKMTVPVDSAIQQRAMQLTNLGFHFFDATHIACAEAAKADVFLSTDDRLLKRASRLYDCLDIIVRNPVRWFIDATQDGE
jgi:predicted nucleic acid-binding protein